MCYYIHTLNYSHKMVRFSFNKYRKYSKLPQINITSKFPVPARDSKRGRDGVGKNANGHFQLLSPLLARLSNLLFIWIYLKCEMKIKTSLIQNFIFFTSATIGGRRLCLSVCLSVYRISQKVVDGSR